MERREVVVADLDEVDRCDRASERCSLRSEVTHHGRSDVRVEAHQWSVRSVGEQRRERPAGPCGGERDGTERDVQGRAGEVRGRGLRRGDVLATQPGRARAVEVEGVGGMAGIVEVQHRERRRASDTGLGQRAHVRVGEAPGEQRAEGIVGERTEEGRRHAEASEPHCDVER